MFLQRDMKWVRLLERGGRKITTNRKGKILLLWVMKDDEIVAVGVGGSTSDAIMRAVKMYVKQNPVCEMATQLTRWQQRQNIKTAKKLLNP